LSWAKVLFRVKHKAAAAAVVTNHRFISIALFAFFIFCFRFVRQRPLATPPASANPMQVTCQMPKCLIFNEIHHHLRRNCPAFPRPAAQFLRTCGASPSSFVRLIAASPQPARVVPRSRRGYLSGPLSRLF
jgi:hypothetical protein